MTRTANKVLDAASIAIAVTVLGGAAYLHLQSTARADAEPAIAALIRSYEKSWNECDTKLYAGLFDPSFSGYSVTAGLAKGSDAAVGTLTRQCEAGIRVNLTHQILDQAVVGDGALVVTFATGSLTRADGQSQSNPLRVTFFLRRQEAQAPWRIRHTHFSAGR